MFLATKGTRLFKLTIVSLIATSISLIILLFVESIASDYYNQAPQIVIDTERVYTQEEVEASAARALESIQSQIEEAKAATNGLVIEEARVLAAAFIWIPWVVVPFMFGVTNRITATLLLLPSVALLSVGVFTIIDLTLFLIATNLQTHFRGKHVNKRSTKAH